MPDSPDTVTIPRQTEGAPSPLVAVGDVASLAGVAPETVNQWVRRHPTLRALGYRTSGGWVWVRTEVEEWLRRTGRLTT